MQAQTAGWLKEHRISRIALGAAATLGLVAASIVGIQALTDGQTIPETQHPLPAEFFEAAPPMPESLVDPYVGQDTTGASGTVAGPDITTLNLDRDGADAEPANVARPAGGVDATTLNLDRDGADVVAD